MLEAPKALDVLYPYMKELTGTNYKKVGFTPTTPFKALFGTMLSLRARGSVVAVVERQLFERVSTPQEIVDMPSETLRGLIRSLGHGDRRVRFLKATAQVLIDKHEGKVPDSLDALLDLPGVGQKTANLTLDAGFGRKTVTVDTHVHRIMNIWGYVDTKNANQTEEALREKLPKRYWKTFNPLLVDFGNKVCWPTSPKCSKCPLGEMCPKIGVTRSR